MQTENILSRGKNIKIEYQMMQIYTVQHEILNYTCLVYNDWKF
jgi:hypothetical protein